MAERKSKSVVSRNPTIVISRILDAAQSEFMAHGFEAASTNRITDGFGGSKATVFRYFSTKEEMLEAVVRRIAGRWREEVTREAMPDDAPRPWLEMFAARSLAWILSDEPLFLGRLAISEGAKLPKLSRIFEETASSPLRDTLASQLRVWAKAGLLASADPKRDAVHFLDMLIGGPVSRALYGANNANSKEQTRHIGRGVDLFLQGCSTQRPSSKSPV